MSSSQQTPSHDHDQPAGPPPEFLGPVTEAQEPSVPLVQGEPVHAPAVPPAPAQVAVPEPARLEAASAAASQRSWLTRPLAPRALRVGAVGVLGASLVFGAGWAAGAADPMLAPVQLVAPVEAPSGMNVPERVYQTVKDAVVTVTVDGGGLGSGFFYRPDRIVTNFHVVSTSPQVLADLARGRQPQVAVTLSDGRERTARVVAVDERLDLAVLSVPSGLGVRPLAFGDSRRLSPGQDAVVVGSPFGLSTSVTAGVISGTARQSQFATDPVQSQLVQTDAAVNPGNSGGPLLDASAAVVGVVTLRPDEAEGRSAQGLAFALPSHLVVSALQQLERYGEVSHPVLGVLLKGDGTKVAVTEVTRGSAAAQAGVRAGDVVLAVGGEQVRTPTDVISRVSTLRAGERVPLLLERDGKRVRLSPRLAERPVQS